MKGALIIFAFLGVVGIVLYIFEYRYRCNTRNKREGESIPEDNSVVEGCCGMHLVCEKESLSPVDVEIEYYDDEELDRFAGREADQYSPEEIEEIRDVLMTLREEDVAGWARSITKRGIDLPPEIKDELFMMVRERRGL